MRVVTFVGVMTVVPIITVLGRGVHVCHRVAMASLHPGMMLPVMAQAGEHAEGFP